MPVKTDLDSYECRHGMGYTRFISEKDGINANLLTFAPAFTTKQNTASAATIMRSLP